MQRSDYETIASAIHEADIHPGCRQTIALEMATGLCSTDHRFDPAKFLEQCDVSLTAQEIADYSHALKLRTTTGVGTVREHIRRANGL